MKKSHVTLTVRFTAQPGKGSQLQKAACGLLTPTRQEPGCIDYYFHVSKEDPDSCLFYENWIDQESLDKHSNSPHVKEFQKTLESLLAEEPEFISWTVLE